MPPDPEPAPAVPAEDDEFTAPDEPVLGAEDLPDEVRDGDASAGDTTDEEG